MISFKRLLILLLLPALFGCVKADRHGDNPGNRKSLDLDQRLTNYNLRAFFEAGNINATEVDFGVTNPSTGEFKKVGNSENDWREVNSIQILFELCGLRDRASQGTIRGEKFHISSELGSKEIKWTEEGKSSEISNPVMVNSNNCLAWSQHIRGFNFLAPAVNLAIHYKFESLAGNLGTLIRRLKFNPWEFYRTRSQSVGLVDITDLDRKDWGDGTWVTGDSVVSALKGELFESQAELRFDKFTVEPVEREKQRVAEYNKRLSHLSAEEREKRKAIDRELLTKRNAGLHINMNMNAKPVIWVNDSNGLPHKLQLDTGRFKVFMNLIATSPADDEKKYLLSSNVTELTGRTTAFEWNLTREGQLHASVPLLLRADQNFGSVELLVKVQPVSPGLRQVKPFTAVYRLGRYDNWVRRQNLSFQFDENFEPLSDVNWSIGKKRKSEALGEEKFKDYIDGIEGVAELDKLVFNSNGLRKLDRFYFGPLKMRFVRIMPGETSTDRTLQYSVSTCVEHGLFGSRVDRGVQFEITTDNAGVDRVMLRKTNEDGCLTWFGLLSHKYYRKEVLEKKKAIVKYVGPKGDRKHRNQIINQYDEQFEYYMNPWDEKWTFGWDQPDMPEGYAELIEKERETAPVSQLYLADFKYETMGFRYAIDKYLNLKVKKAVLFKAFPYVLKYNSIVRGRLGTEKLRDGIYLMKVALQKDYLDPAAKGVRIYDEEIKEPIQIANEPEVKQGRSRNKRSQPEEENSTETLYDLHDEQLGDAKHILGNEMVDARMDYVSRAGAPAKDVNHRLLTKTELKESRKRYISVQTKLVRVLGGIIVTPIEFEVNDLRLMRIRNQFFIQLETIDESKLRLATQLDQKLNEMFEDGDLEAKYSEIFTTIDELQELKADSERIKGILENYNEARMREQSLAELKEVEGNMARVKARLYSYIGLDKYEEGSEEFLKKKEQWAEKFVRLDQFRNRINAATDFTARDTIFQEKRDIIDRLLFQLKRKSLQELETARVETEQIEEAESGQQEDEDPFLKFFYMGNSKGLVDPLEEILSHSESAKDFSLKEAIEDLKYDDFSQSALTPSFDLNLLSNEGEHDPTLNHDDGKSGLPQRTFVGPLTFVFNTNGSSLRPTDILGEQFCNTASCEMPPDEVSAIKAGLPPNQDVEKAAVVDKDGNLLLANRPIYTSGESVNADYENNEYYGYLRAYANMTVDKLIDEKKIVDEAEFRKMETGAQIINFTKTMDLKFSLLQDNPRSRLKGIDFKCTQNIEASRIENCFNDITDDPDVMSRDQLFAQMNEREFTFPELDPDHGKKRKKRLHNKFYYGLAGSDPITDENLKLIMKEGWLSDKVDPLITRRLMHRMCFVLAQNFFKPKYFDKDFTPPSFNLFRGVTKEYLNKAGPETLEAMCHRYTGRVFGYFPKGGNEHAYNRLGHMATRRGESIQPKDVRYPPVIFERKLRAYRATQRYVYRGGKSLNINAQTSFGMSESQGLKVSTTASWKPWDWIKDAVGLIPKVGTVAKSFVGGFGVSRSAGRDESVGETNGISVSSGTYLVSQQATIDIELGEYERCLVVRLHPGLIKNFLSGDEKWGPYLKDTLSTDDEDSDIESQGVMICTGVPERKCLPIKEKYFYFTQHFTEGDMLDTADLHNHPWLLQLRGYRDFQVFATIIGAREVRPYTNNWLKDVGGAIANDVKSMNMIGSHIDNEKPKFEIVNRSQMNWPLDELSRTYFQVLPTFPGIYTYMNEAGVNVSEWPYDKTDPGRSFQQCQ